MKLNAMFLSSITLLLTTAAFSSSLPSNTQTLEIGGTKINITLNKGTQAPPSLGVAYKNDAQFIFKTPDVFWEANEKNLINGSTQNNIHNATLDQFLKNSGNTESFRILVDDGSSTGLIPTMTKSNYKYAVAPAFDLTKNKTKNCTVSYVTDSYGQGYWTSSCKT